MILQNMEREFIGNNYFPKELSNWLCSKSFAQNLNILNNWLSEVNKYKVITKPTKFKIPRDRYNYRTLSIPNPKNYYLLSRCIVKNWDDLYNFLNESELSITKPSYDRVSNTFRMPEYRASDLQSIFYSRSIASKYLLKIDLKEYYKSIYSHSIPWALHGKSYAKENRGNDYIGNKIDTLVRNMNDQQTNGIPVGPFTSVIISEILGSYLDSIIQEFNYNDAFRCIDDFFIFLNSKSDAEEILKSFLKECDSMELQINPTKTTITELPKTLDPKWISKVNNIQINPNHILSFINNLLHIQEEFPNENVLVYGLYRLYYCKKDVLDNLTDSQWQLLYTFVLNTFIYDSKCSELAFEVLIKFNLHDQQKYFIKQDVVLDIFKVLLDDTANPCYDYSLIWMLELCKVLDINLPTDILNEFQDITNPILILSILKDYHNSDDLKTEKWTEYMNEESLNNEYWILAYEASINNWLPTPSNNFIDEDPFFYALKLNNISFLNYLTTDELINYRRSNDFVLESPERSVCSGT